MSGDTNRPTDTMYSGSEGSGQQELLPCPFCGSEARAVTPYGVTAAYPYTISVRHYTECPLIAVRHTYFYPSREAALFAWNSRK